MAGLCSKEQLILGFHKLEGDVFHRLVHELGQDPANMRWVIAFWLWLESVGHHDFVRRLSALPAPVVLRFVAEAIVCLRCLAGQDTAANCDSRDRRLPCTNALLAEPVDDVDYLVGHRDKVLDGVKYLYKNVCLVVCDGNVTTCVPDNTGCARAAPPAISSPGRAAPMMIRSHGGAAPPMASSTLNPMATPWVPLQMQSTLPEDYRSLFITFSRGYPIDKEDIEEFFNSVFGPCVEAVMVEKVVQPGQLPVYGRVVLRNPAMIQLVLDGQQTAKFVIKGRHLWARVYIPSSRLPLYA